MKTEKLYFGAAYYSEYLPYDRVEKDMEMMEKAKKLIYIIKENPFQNPPPYEELVGNLQGVYSRRINIQHRLVYQVYNQPVVINETEYEGIIKVIRMWTHYDKVR